MANSLKPKGNALHRAWFARIEELEREIAQLKQARPAPPAIPDEVLDTLLAIVDGHYRYEGKIKAARAWLASAPVATDKAVCPKCGKQTNNIIHDQRKARCWECGHTCDIDVLVISPPRTEKGGAK